MQIFLFIAFLSPLYPAQNLRQIFELIFLVLLEVVVFYHKKNIQLWLFFLSEL